MVLSEDAGMPDMRQFFRPRMNVIARPVLDGGPVDR